uniref:Uncharacterized protein n=1 Tax=Meloidogyne hapla TaxID=6305 RepID=A0A1I8BB66_MELHA
MDENNSKNILKIIIEITDSFKTIFIVPNKEYKTPYNNKGKINKKYYLVEKAKNIRDGIKEINILEDFDNIYREGIVICGRKLNKRIYETLMIIKSLFHNKLFIEPKEVEEDIQEIKLIKFEWLLDFKNQNNNFIKICIKFKNKGNYLINITFDIINTKLLQFYFKINNESVNCISNEIIEENNLIKLKEKIFIFYNILIENNEELDFNNFNESNNIDIILLNITEIEPLFNDGIYEFYMENNGNIKQKKNNIIKYLNKRELNKINKNKILPFIKSEMNVLIDGNYYKMNKNGKVEKLN